MAGENILSAVDSLGSSLSKQLEKTGENNKRIIKENIAVEVEVVQNRDIVYPNKADGDQDWVSGIGSSIHLPAKSLGGK